MSIRVLRFASLGQLMVFQLALTFAQAAEYEPRPAGYQGYGSNDSSGTSTPSGTASERVRKPAATSDHGAAP